jgi:hypothetical protein
MFQIQIIGLTTELVWINVNMCDLDFFNPTRQIFASPAKPGTCISVEEADEANKRRIQKRRDMGL